MEQSDGHSESLSLPKRAAAAARGILRILVQVDMNPHEGRLRGSAMPAEYMRIPDDASVLIEFLPES